MKNVVLIIKNTVHFILSLLLTWKNSLFQKKEYAIIPASNLPIQTKTRRWKSISIHRNVRVLLIMLVLSGWSYGQSIFTNPITGTSITTNPYTTGQTLNANITSTGIGRGSGLSASGANDRYNVTSANTSSLANAISGNDFFEFSITPNSCYEIDFTSLVYTSQISTGSINLALRSNVDAYAANIATSTSTTGATFSLTAASFQNRTSNTTFRLYVWGATAGGTTFSINDFTFNGAVVSLGGTLSGGTTVCTGTNSTTLTLSGQTGSITKWQSSTSSTFASAVTDITNTTTTLTASNLTTTTYYRAVVSAVPCYSSTATITVTPNNTVTLSSAAGTNAQTKCINTAITNITYGTTGAAGATFSGLPAGVSGAWAANVATISGTPSASGTSNYTVTLTGGCGAVTATGSITVTAAPNAGTLSGTQNICIAGTTTFTTSGNAGGAWTSDATGVATVNSSTGLVTGVGSGTATITYTVTGTGGCANATVTRSVTVTAAPNAGTLSGTQNICIAGTTTFTTSGNAGGAWTSDATGVATVNSSTGLVTGVGSGTATITYTVTGTGGCANATATRTVTVTAAPNAGTLSGTQNICVAGTTTFTTSGNAGGAWTSGATGTATVNSSTGDITGVAAGSATITYTVTGTGGCANATATRTVTVSPVSVGGSIAGTATVCSGTNSTTLTLSGYTGAITRWESSLDNFSTAGTAIANTTTTLTASNLTATTSYRAVITSGVCAAANSATATITVNPPTPATPAAITGTATQCPALTSQTYSIAAVTNASTYNWTVPSGWSITAGAGSTSITVTTGSSGQNGNISVTAQNSCGTSSAQVLAVTVSPATPAQPATISGTATQCPTLTSQTYSIAAVTNASSYNWTVPSGWSITSGAGSTSITVTTGSAGQNGNISVTAQNSCGTSIARTLAVTVSPATPAQPGSIVGLTSFCNGQTGNSFSILPVTDASTYNWTAPAGWVLTAGSGTNSVTYTTGSVSGNISVSAQNSCGTSAVRNLAVTVLSNMVANAPSISPTICSGVSIGTITHTTSSATSISNDGVSGANGLPAGVSASWASNIISISGISTVPGTYNYSISLLGGCGTANATGTIIITPANTAGVASSTPTVCINTALTNITHATTGATGIANAGTAGANGLPAGVAASWNSNTITIFGTPSAAGTFNYSIPLQGGCGSINATGTITVSPVSVGGTIAGAATVCSGTNSTALTLSGHTGSITRWESSLNNFSTAGTAIANTTTSFTASNLTATTSYRAVVTSGACAAANSASVTITVNPPTPVQPATITGTATQCPALTSQTYSIAAVTNATSYNWTVPTGWSITAGAGTTSITVTTGSAGQNGNISVTAQNSCGTSSAQTLAVTVSPAIPAQPGTITGIATQCPNLSSQNYSVTAVPNASTYNWTLPTGWFITAGSGTNSITATTGSVGQNGNISVTAQNSCGTSSAQTLAVTVSPAAPIQPSLISGTATQCPALTSQSYSIPAVTNATTYNWTVPAGWNITAGAGTTSITVTTGTSGQNGNISVTAQNSCGTSTARTLAVTVSPATPVQPATITGTATQCPALTSQLYSIAAVTNATTYNWTVPSGWSITAGAGTTSITVTTGSAGQNGNISVTAQNSCGTSSAQTLAVTVSPATPATPAAAAGSNVACTSISANWAASANATAYLLDVSTVSNFASFVPGFSFLNVGNVTTYSVTGLSANTTYYYRVRANNSCGSSGYSSTITYATSPVPAQPSTITGTLNPEIGLTQAYSVTNVAGVTYAWSFSGPNGWSVASGQGSNAIVANVGTANTTITVVPSNTCGNGTSQTITTTIPQYRARFISADYGTSPWCQGESRSISVVVKNTGVASWTNATPDVNIGARWNANGANWTDFHYRMDANNLASGATQTYTFASMQSSNAIGFGSYNTPPAYVGSLNTGNNNIVFDIVKEGDCWFGGNGGTCGPGNAVLTTPTIVISASAPATPLAITGTATQCPALTSQTYSIGAVANATTYNWTVPTGWSITAGAGSTSITVTTGTSGQNGNISVTAQNSCGTSAAQTLAVTVSPAAPTQPVAITGTATQCPALTAQTYSIGAVTNATTYNWTVPAGWSITAGAGTTSITVTTGSAGQNGNISVTAQNSCGTSTARTLAVTVSPATPAQPGTITGTATQCPALASQTYTISAVTNATSYNWTVPTGWSITANSGTSITVTTGTSGQNGNISVTAQNSCGTSIAKTLAVTVSPATPAVATAAAGTNAACTTISANWAASANATAYLLDVSTVNTFASFVGAYNNLNVGNVTTVSVTGLTAGVTYFYRVRANNSCGTSASSSVITYATTPATPAQPGTITGTAAQCAGLTGQVYSIGAVANATTYNWSVPTGWTITAGAGSTSITVTTGTSGQNGNISVTSQNSCGTSAARTLAVTVTAIPTVNVGAGLAAICAGGASAALGGSVTAPATGGTWTSSDGGTFNPNATTLNATWTAPASFSGTATLTLTSSGGICGTATGSKSITVNPLPANAGAITGTATVCQGQSGVVYQIAALADATSYSWSYSGTGFTASGSTASIFGSFSATATSGTLTVRGVNACGNGVVSANYSITVGSAPAAAGAITGSPSLCQGQNGVAYSVAPIAGATSYLWSYTGTGFTPSGTTASITADFSASATAGTLTVRGVNSCGNGVASANYNISVAQLPGTPGTILGPSTVCKGQAGFTFTIPAITNATSYNWQYTGTGVTFSGNTNLVTITVSNTATSGVIRVRGVSACLNGPFSANFSVTVNNAPTVSITSNYCGNPGFVILTASPGFSNYLWNTGATTSFINADIAGQYTVTAANSTGCLATASVGVATELVTNGSFSAGNTGFTTNYTYVADGAGQTEMYPEGTYAIVPNSNTVHNAFWGTGHTPAGGPYMVVNGHPTLGQAIWSQNSIAVQPNTTYYFSAWGLSVVNGNNAVLRFSINGSQVGTTAFLPNGYSSTAGPFNWVRFYGSWNSGFATTANLSIINLNTILGGNDFGLDDISFGTLSPVALSVAPSTLIGTTVCQGNELVLNANAVGGASPFTYQWTGPNGFTSTLMNPIVTASASAANAGTYTLTVTDGFGCTATSNVVVTISALPLDKTPVASLATVCFNGSSSITIASSQTGISYQLRNDADDSSVGDPVAGTGGTISFPVENLSATSTFNVLATGALTQCSVEMSATVTITVATTPVLAISNQAVCSGTVDLTAAAVTAGSTGSGTLSYWTDAAGTLALGSPSSVASSGIYYIRSTVGSCSDIEPVSVSISSTPQTTFSYPTTPYCSTELDPAASLNAGSVAGIFTATPAGLVFLNTASGIIDLSASIAGTYTVRNTVSPSGGCPSVNSTSSIVITQAPLTDFSYDAGSDFCQIYSAQNPAPVFLAGAAAGTFASTFGLNFISAATGVVNLQTSTPGNYAIWNTRPAVGGCLSESDTVFIDINPFVFDGSVTTSISDDIICLGETVDLFSQTSAYSSVLLRERFNGTINNWVRSTTGSVGGTIANAAWTLRPTNYVDPNNSVTHRSNDNTQFYMSNSQSQAGTSTLTTLRSPVMSTVGYTNLSMDFFQYFSTTGTSDAALVQVSLNNSTWTTVATYTAAQGSATGFTNSVINLNAYIGQPVFYVRFQYNVTNDRLWAIDNVSLTGNCTKYNYNWASAPAGFSSTSANPLNVVPPQNSFYVVNATNTFGCSNPSSPIPVTVNALPILTSSLTPPAVCGNEVFTYVPASTPSSALISWTRPVAAGITNAAIAAAQSGNPSETLVNITNSDKSVIYNFTLDNNGCSQVVPVTLTVKPIPVIDLGANLSVCNGSPAQLNTTITNGLSVNTYSWSPSTGLSNTAISDPTAIVPSASQNYTVTVQSTNGCSNTSAAVSVTNVGFGGTPGLWLGTLSTDWNDCRNWSDGKIPTNVTNVTVDGNALNDIEISGSQQCNNLLFLSNNNVSRTITLAASATLQAVGNVAVAKSSGTETITLRVLSNATLTCNNLSISGTAPGANNAIVQKDVLNSIININGNLSIDPGAQLDMNDNNNTTSEGKLLINDNFVNNANAADFNVGNVEVIFNGSVLQTITCPTNQDFGNITLDNSSVAGVKLNNSIKVSRGMQFINGVLDLNQKTLTLGTSSANAVLTGSGNNSYILAWDGSDNGTIIQQVNNTGFNYLFPIGDLNEYTPFSVNLSSATLSNATLTAKLNGTVNPNIVGSTNYLGRFWSIEPSGITNPVYSVQYSYAAGDIVGSEGFLFPAKYNSGGWQSCNGSASNAMIGTGSVNAGTNTLTWSGITTFSEFTAIGNGSPLPIELLDFNAVCDGSKVNISWTTASESNNKQFIVEESNDAKNWVVVKTELGAGNSNTLRNYAVSVNANYSNGSYYRLTQVDYNGDSETFDPIYVNCDVKVSNEVNIYPVPAFEVSNLDIKASEDMDIQLTVFSSTGQILLSQKTALKRGNNIITLDIANLSPGMYHVNIINDKKIEFSGSRSIIKR